MAAFLGACARSARSGFHAARRGQVARCARHRHRGRRQCRPDRAADRLPHGRDHRLRDRARGPAVRRGDLRRERRGRCDAARARRADDGDRVCRTHRRRVRRPDRHAEGQRGSERDHDVRAGPGPLPGPTAPDRGDAGDAAAHGPGRYRRNLRRGAGNVDLRHRLPAVLPPAARGGDGGGLRPRHRQGCRLRR